MTQLATQTAPLTPTTLASMDELELLDRINSAYQAAQDHYKKSVVNAIMVGVLLSQAKGTCAHGNFKEWIKAKLPYISYDTANRYRKLAEAIRDSKVARATFDAEQLLQLPFLPETEQDEVLTKIEKITEGKNLKQLYFDFDVVRRPDPKGGKRVAEATEQDKNREPTLEETRTAAQGEWKALLSRVEDVHQQKLYAHLPKIQRQAILDTLYQIVDAIEEIED